MTEFLLGEEDVFTRKFSKRPKAFCFAEQNTKIFMFILAACGGMEDSVKEILHRVKMQTVSSSRLL